MLFRKRTIQSELNIQDIQSNKLMFLQIYLLKSWIFSSWVVLLSNALINIYSEKRMYTVTDIMKTIQTDARKAIADKSKWNRQKHTSTLSA